MFTLYDMMIILTSLLLTLCGDNHTGRGPDSDRGRESDGGGGGPGAGGPRRPSDLAPQTVLGSVIGGLENTRCVIWLRPGLG